MGCFAIETPLTELIRRSVLEGGSASAKIAFVPDWRMALLMADKLDGLKLPPEANASITGNSRMP
jgi:hypothetical protein